MLLVDRVRGWVGWVVEMGLGGVGGRCWCFSVLVNEVRDEVMGTSFSTVRELFLILVGSRRI